MPFNGSGTYSLPIGSIVADGTTIDAADHNTPLQDIEAALSQVLPRNGSAPMGGDLPMGGNAIKNVSSIDVGNADTTITRSAAGVLAVEGGIVPLENRANTFSANQVISVTDNTNAALRITQLGTGLALRVEDEASPDSTPFVIDASGNVGIGTATPVTSLDTAGPIIHGATHYFGSNLYFSGGWKYKSNGYGAYLQLADGSGVLSLATAGNNVSGAAAAATTTTRLTIDASGNILNISSGGLGYGAGSGGAVTQITSKSTSVTLNKTNGQITLNNASLAANAVATFVLNNSTISSTDTIIVSVSNSVSGAQNYNCWIGGVANGSCTIGIRNISAGALSDAVVLNFSVIKAVTS